MPVIVSLVIYLLLSGLLWWLICLLPMPAPWDRVVHVVFIVLLLLIILAGVGLLPGLHLPLIQL